MKDIIELGTKHPQKLFLIDASGAILSALLLSVVLVNLDCFLGIPETMLYSLSILPILFAIYDIYCLVRELHKTGLYLTMIAILNIGYCFLSMAFAIYHYQSLTILGWLYIVFESIIITFLAYIEYSVGKSLTDYSHKKNRF